MRAKVELFVDLDAVAADAAGALDHDAQTSLYDTLDWFRLTKRHVLPNTPIVVARARSAKGAAWLFLAECALRHGEPLGSWYTLRYAPIFVGAPDATERANFVADIARALRTRFARLTLGPVDGEDLSVLKRGFSQAGWFTGDTFQTANWVAHTAGDDFSAYWTRRPGQLKSTVRRKANKANLDIRIADAFDADAWDAYEAVFAASWKGDEGSPAFLRALAESTASWGQMRMAVAYDGAGAPMAAQFWTIDGPADARVATIHKLAYVDTARALSPGSILSHAMFRHVIERDRPAMIDFGTGDDPYKADWMDEKRALYRFDAYNVATVAGLGGYLRSRIVALVARLRND